MALQAAVDELYALPPEQFTAARDDFAKRLRQAGERELAAAVRELRRPSVAAWLVNVLVRHRSDDLDQLLDLGAELRAAMTGGTGEDVRHLTELRRKAVTTMVAAVAALTDRPVPPAVAAEVQATLEAATADPTAAAAVRSGRLVRSLRYAGFGELPDLAGAVGLAPDRGAPKKRPVRRTTESASTAAKRREAERKAHEAAGVADDAQRTYEQRLAERADTEASAVAAAKAVNAATDRLRQAEQELAGVREAERHAADAVTTARRTARAAHQAADAARERLAALRSDSAP